jgi:tetratricopeptide (TPR) repeat protein
MAILRIASSLALLALAGALELRAQGAQARRLRAVPADVVSLLLAGREGGDLDATVAAQTAPSGALQSVDVEIEVPAVDAAAAGAPTIELYVYALGPRGEVRAYLAEVHSAPGATGTGGAAETTVLGARLDGLSGNERVRVLVREPVSARFALREIALQPSAAATAEAAAPRPPAKRRDVERYRGRVKSMAEAYEAILRSYASGAGARAVEELRRYERDALTGAGKQWAETLAGMGEAEAAVADRLASREPDSLVPLLLLHLDLHDRHLEQRDLALASHSRERVNALAELYAAHGRTEVAPRLASSALQAVGSFLQGANQITAGRKLLARAVELDARNLEARLAIALGHEVHGEYEEALQQLDQLATFGSWDDEVRLRRATLFGRLDRADEAVAAYESLIASSRQDWIVVLAYQELARIRVEQQRPGAAAAALEQATRRFPRDRTLQLHLAYALERAGNPARARQLLDGVDRASASPPSDPLPRTRYHRGIDLVGRRSELLARSSLALLPMLAGTLESLGGAAPVGGA